jgi:tetratricopeptide (TPR) repeat protein
MKIKSALLIGMFFMLSGVLYAQGPSAAAPMTEKEVIKELKSQGADQLIKDVGQRGVDFEMDADIEKGLRKAKATDAVVQAVKAASPKARAQAKAAGVGPTGPMVGAEEGKAFDAIKTELDPDRTIALAEDFANKYPNSPVLTYVFWFEANAYQGKNDPVKVVKFCHLSLDLKNDNLMSLLVLTSVEPQPQYLNTRVDKEKALDEVETDSQAALKLIDALPKQGTETDADLAKRKAEYIAAVHGSLGMVHLQKAQLGLMGIDKDELAKAEQDYTQAVTVSAHPDARDYFRLGESYRMDGKIDQAIDAFTKAGDLGGQGSALKQYADAAIAELKKAKTGAQTPAKP